MKNVIWDIQCISPPLVIQYCKKCGKRTEYISSGQFRVNAQRKYLDIWLIYKCTKCDATWNATIYSRINSTSISGQLLECFQNNDEMLSREYAMNTGLLQQNGVKVQAPVYNILGEDFIINEPVKLQIRSQYHFDIKIFAILREKLKLSQNELEKLIWNGSIRNILKEDLRKIRLNKEITLLFNIPN
jgi:hypothetical protein